MIVTGSDIGYQRSQGIEGSFPAVFQLQVHIFLDLLHGYMSRTFDDRLYIVFPGSLAEFAQCLQFFDLSRVVGIGDTTGTQAVSQGNTDIIFSQNLADLFEMFVNEAFLFVGRTPMCHDRTSPGNNAGKAFQGQRHMFPTQAGVNGKIVYSLFGLFDQGIPENLPIEFFNIPADFLQGLV